MGNQPSSSSQRSSASQGAGESNINSTSSSSRSRSRSHSHGHGHGHSQSLSSNATLQPPRDPNPRGGRRESIHALSSVKATAAPPSASLESAAAPAAHNNNSTLTVASVASTLRAAHDNSRPNSIAVTSSTANPPPDTTSITSRMGAEQSRQRHHRDRPSGEQQQQQQSGQSIIHKARSAPSPQSQPVDVPAHHNLNQHLHHHPQAIPPTNMQSPATTMSADAADNATPDYFAPPPQQFARPPRLPLPIEEELHTPGSPIISPADLAPVDIAEGAEGSSLASRASVLSSITTEDDDAVDEFPRPHTGPTVPTLIEWEGGGEKVYVTGTFVEWNRKFRLHRNGPSKKKNVLSTIVPIAPGTHHLKFIVDNDMRTSDKLPTAVDFTNILVNYLEVSADDVPQPPAPARDETTPAQPPPLQELRPPPGVYPPQTLPPTPELVPVQQPVPETAAPKGTAPAMTGRYHRAIPRYLLDLDAPDESERFRRASAASAHAESLPAPPSLPLFLNKSILNGVTPMKDDSSVLNLPNHTVLNHLATSSIKDNILATSATTRYKQKFLTTIMYKPKNDEGHDTVAYANA